MSPPTAWTQLKALCASLPEHSPHLSLRANQFYNSYCLHTLDKLRCHHAKGYNTLFHYYWDTNLKFQSNELLQIALQRDCRYTSIYQTPLTFGLLSVISYWFIVFSSNSVLFAQVCGAEAGCWNIFNLPAGAMLTLLVEGAERALQQAGASLPGSGVLLLTCSFPVASDLQAIWWHSTSSEFHCHPNWWLPRSLTDNLNPQHTAPQPLHHPRDNSQFSITRSGSSPWGEVASLETLPQP